MFRRIGLRVYGGRGVSNVIKRIYDKTLRHVLATRHDAIWGVIFYSGSLQARMSKNSLFGFLLVPMVPVGFNSNLRVQNKTDELHVV